MRVMMWFRRDLRLADNEALHAAAAVADELIPFFCDGTGDDEWDTGAASRWWLHQSLSKLAVELERQGSKLIVARGGSRLALQQAVAHYKPDFVYCNRRYEPAQQSLEADLMASGIPLKAFAGALLREPGAVKTGSGTSYEVFTPYWRVFLKQPDFDRALPPPKALPPLPRAPKDFAGVTIEDLQLLPAIPWDAGLTATWAPGETSARQAVDTFLASAVKDYEAGRDLPAISGTSRLSPHLAFGEISPRALWHMMLKPFAQSASVPTGVSAYLRQLIWREFAYQLLVHHPQSPDRALRPKFEAFPWRARGSVYDRHLAAWKAGQTGYPLVDAGMRELWHTGWMHNRVRMVVASFLVKHLLIPWQEGARWFWDTLVDADLANNTFGWQWSAGSGADAAPYFRVFNPVLQGKKFDPDGDYVRHWVPELRALATKHLHAPWTAQHPPPSYPRPIVDHDAARLSALKAYDRLTALNKKQ